MTQKELSYVEDAIMHEEHIIKLLQDLLEYLDDNKLVSYFKSQIKSHTNLKEKLISILEDLS